MIELVQIPKENTNLQAAATVTYDAIVDKVGVHTSRTSHLNEEPKVSDGVEYQEWSYGIQSSVNPKRWLGITKDLFHPAGLTVIPNFTVDVGESSIAIETVTVVSTA